MRLVLIGPGAVGGVVGGRLFQHGHDVVLVARGDHRDAIAERGLTVEWPEGSANLPVPVVGSPAEIRFGPDDVVIIAVKSQDTAALVESLAAAAPPETPVVCLQNGVANEVAFLRRFRSVHGVPVMAPTSHLEPGVVRSATSEAMAILDVGCWPSGVDEVTEAVATAFRSSGFESVARPDIRRWKYAKLLLNLANPVDALCRRGDDFDRLARLARDEGRAVLEAAGIDYVSSAVDRERRGDLLRIPPAGDGRRPGGSTWQSLARGLPVEVDHLNGEIVLLARLHRVPAPVNELLQAETHRAVATGAGPGSVEAADLLSRL